MSVEEKFQACLKVSNARGCPASIDDGLELYGLLKQATRGDINKAKPSSFNPVERAKWEAWNLKKGVPKEEAMERFVHNVRKMYSCDCG